MVTSSPSLRKVLLSPPPRSMSLDPLHDSSSMEPKDSGSFEDTKNPVTVGYLTERGKIKTTVRHSMTGVLFSVLLVTSNMHFICFIVPDNMK